jgi:VanZ family protein
MPAVNSHNAYKNNFFYRWGPALLIMGVIFTISSFPSTSIPNYGNFDFLVKKSGHLLGYTTLALAYCHALRVEDLRLAGLAWVLAVLFSISDEFHQSFVPGRTAWIVDNLIDACGALLGVLAWWLVHIKRR